MHKDREKWNEKYLSKPHSTAPSRIVQRYFALAPKGKALDIAAGAGANAVFLADHGFEVEAVDISDVAMTRLSGRHPKLHPVCADLDAFDIPADRYSLILNIRFLNRRLFPYICEGLIRGGLLIFETYREGPENDPGPPSCRDYLLRDNELLHAFLSLKVLFYQETNPQNHEEEPRHLASLVAVKVQ